MADATPPSTPTPVASAAATLLDTPAAPVENAAPAADPAPAPDAQATDPANPEAPKPDEPAPLKMPSKDATAEEWAAFYNQLGRPETPDAYELPVPEGDTGEFAKEMAPILHKHGITAEQAKGLANDWNSMVAAQQEAQAKAQADAQVAAAAKNTAEAADLKNEWGTAHDANMEMARRAVRQFIPGDKPAEVIAALESKLGYKATIQFLHNIGKGLGEGDGAGLGTDTAGQMQTPMQSLASRLYAK